MRTFKCRALAEGQHPPTEGWRPRLRPKVLPGLPPALAGLPERTATAAAAIKEQRARNEDVIESDTPAAPIGGGALTAVTLEREALVWLRFSSGKKLGSFVGLCPSEDSSGQRRRQGAIDKHGSSRLRFWCQETVWRLYKF